MVEQEGRVESASNTGCQVGAKFSFKCLFICLVVLGLSCGTQDLWLWHTDSRLVACGVRSSPIAVRGLSCSTVREILVSQSGIKPMSPVLQGRSLTTGLPGKSLNFQF